jgi:hypothetical protein
MHLAGEIAVGGQYFFFDLVDIEIPFDVAFKDQIIERSPEWSGILDFFETEIDPESALG